LGDAVRTIILADVVMSLDNILAISSAADGDGRLVVVGLILSIPLLLVASDFVSRLFSRVPILVYAGSVLLIWAAVRMFVEDHLVRRVVHPGTLAVLVITATFSAVVIFVTRRMADASISGIA
jgi:predicted tellurium resistance membrane protein TerC